MYLLYLDVVEYLPKGIVIEMDDDDYEQVVDIIEHAGHNLEPVE
jgi:hypothetical protein